MKFSKESIEIKRLVQDLNCMGTFGLVELELIKMEKRREELSKTLKDARYLLLMCSLLDLSGQCNQMVDKIDGILEIDA